MKNLWKVTFDAKYTHCKDWLDEEVKVVANGDGLKAVAKAKRQVIGSEFENEVSEDKLVTCRCVRVRLTGLELLHEIDA